MPGGDPAGEASDSSLIEEHSLGFGSLNPKPSLIEEGEVAGCLELVLQDMAFEAAFGRGRGRGELWLKAGSPNLKASGRQQPRRKALSTLAWR